MGSLTRGCNRGRAATEVPWPPHLFENPEYLPGTQSLRERCDPIDKASGNNGKSMCDIMAERNSL